MSYYKELVLPQKLEAEEKSLTETFGRFVAEPYERGYGHTVGNSLRRVMLSSLEGAAVTAVRIGGVRHEYSSISGVREDALQILLNMKRLRVKLFSAGPEMLYLSAKKEGPVTASEIQENANVKVINGDLVLANLEAGGKLEIEIEISKGRGYATAEELREHANWPAGFLPVDALFSPVTKVHYDVENARVGQITDYDRLVLEVWTDGTTTPKEALAKSAHLLRQSLETFLPEAERVAAAPAGEAGAAGAAGEGAGETALDDKLKNLLEQPIEALELSARASNGLKVAKIKSVRDLVEKKEEELLLVKNFGEKSLTEIKERLKDMGLGLGMKVS